MEEAIPAVDLDNKKKKLSKVILSAQSADNDNKKEVCILYYQ